ncbi:ankyrin repeat-containing domain protein [Phlyctochytrium arcticum]|nr:ankyrin repeat-containing domain protein [Phlyctochytrium arcticum]
MRPKTSPHKQHAALTLSLPDSVLAARCSTPVNSPTADVGPRASFSGVLHSETVPPVLRRVLGGGVTKGKDAEKVYGVRSGNASRSHPREQHRLKGSRTTSDQMKAALAAKVVQSQKLQQAAAEGNDSIITSMLHFEEPDVNFADDRGRTSLHFACAGGHFNVLKQLIAAGANVHATDVKGNTPLHLAVLSNQLDCVLLLLQANAKVNAQDSSQRTALQLVQSRLRILSQSSGRMTSRLIPDLRQLVELLTACALQSHESVSKCTTIDAAALTARLESITSEKDAMDVVDELQRLLDGLTVS